MKRQKINPLFVVVPLLIVLFLFILLGGGNSNGYTVLDVDGNNLSDFSDGTLSVEDMENAQGAIDEDGTYTSKADVALYLHTYGHLPANFITKDEAESHGWSGGGLDSILGCRGKCIGGDRFGNREGLLPDAPGRTYYECDIDTLGEDSRGAKRIVYSNDGLIYYTEDHYDTFELLYGEE